MSCQCLWLPAVNRALLPSVAEAVLLAKPRPRRTVRKSKEQPTSTARYLEHPTNTSKAQVSDTPVAILL